MAFRSSRPDVRIRPPYGAALPYSIGSPSRAAQATSCDRTKSRPFESPLYASGPERHAGTVAMFQVVENTGSGGTLRVILRAPLTKFVTPAWPRVIGEKTRRAA